MNRLFGTNGIRWVVGEKGGGMFSVRLGLAAGTHYGPGSRLCLGMDTRTSSPQIFNAVASGLLSTGCDIIDLGVVPTPVIQYAVSKLGTDGGLIITASHNPPQFNGLKCMAADGTELSRNDEVKIEDIYTNEDFRLVDWQGIGKTTKEYGIQSAYKQDLIENNPLGPKKPLAIVDCTNGTAGPYTPEILTGLGCRVITMNAQPDGRFPGRLPEPTENHIRSLMTTVKENYADLGIAHDGDADRATFVDENGKYVTGDQSLAIFAIDVLKRAGKGIVVVPINTSKIVLDVVDTFGGTIIETPIGSPLIARTMIENGAILGGEGNGGVIFSEHHVTRDGIMAGARMTQILSNEERTLSEMISELPVYHLQRDKLSIPAGISKKVIMERVRNEAEGDVIDLDGIKMVHDDHWVLVRFSGTEPIIRISAESGSASRTAGLLQEYTGKVKDLMDSLSS